MRLLLLLLITIGCSLNAPAQEYVWHDRNGGLGGDPAGFLVNAEGHVLFGSTRGLVLLSVDNGASWEVNHWHPGPDSITSLCWGKDENDIYATRSNGAIWHSDTKYLSWKEDSELPEPGVSMVITNDEDRYAFGPNVSPVWYRPARDLWRKSTLGLVDIVKAPNGNLIAHDGSILSMLQDGATDWTVLFIGNQSQPVVYLQADAGGGVIAIRRLDNTVQECAVYRSVDGGENWDFIGAQDGAGGIATADSSGRVYLRTTLHAGYFEELTGNWVETSTPAGTSALFAPEAGKLIAYSPAGLHLSTDYGATWELKRISTCNITGELAISWDMYYRFDTAMLLQAADHCYISTDAGLTWEIEEYTETHDVRLEQMSEYVSYAIAAPRSGNGPRTLIGWDGYGWDSVYSFDAHSNVRGYLPEFYSRLAVLDDDSLMLWSDRFHIWAYRPVPAPGGHFILPYWDDFYCLSPSGIYKSTNDGVKWQQISTTPFTGESLHSFQHYPNDVYVQTGEPLYSTDLGETWQQIRTSLTPSVQRIRKINKSFFLTVALTESGVLVAKEWPWQWMDPISENLGREIVDFCLDSDSVWAVGKDGGVYLGEHVYGTYVGVEDSPSAIGFSLSAPYPNPVISSATVNYTLQSPSAISLKLVDILGRTVATIEEGPHAPGTHTVTLSTAALKPGTYFLRLETPGGMQVKPVAVVR